MGAYLDKYGCQVKVEKCEAKEGSERWCRAGKRDNCRGGRQPVDFVRTRLA